MSAVRTLQRLWRGPKWLLAAILVAVPGCYDGLDETAQAGPEDEEGSDDAGGSDGEEDDDGGGAAAKCGDESAPRATLLRMNRTTYVNALTEVFGADAVASVQTSINAMPGTKVGMFASETAAPSYSEVAATVDIGAQLAYRLTLEPAALATLEPCLADVPAGATPADNACLSEFMETKARLIIRRTLTDEDRARLAGDFAVGGDFSVAEGVATFLIALLIDPEFLYFVQSAGEEIADGVVALTPYETAAKLARVLWNSVPDDELLDAADAGLDEALLAEQVDRMLDDPRAQAAIAAFYYDWFELERMPLPSEVRFPDPEVRGALRDAMELELLQFARTMTLDKGATYAELLLDRSAVVELPELAELYGITPGSEEVLLPENQRAGILTRAAFVSSGTLRGSDAGHLIRRGARVSRFLCRPLPLPDPGAFPQEDPADPGTDPDRGIRERFQAATAEAMCAACHVQLDSFGAPLGNYGGSGEWITVETVELPSGETAELPINTVSTVEFDDGPVEITDGLALSRAVAESRVGARCMAQQLTRNIVARALEPGDACMVDIAGAQLAPEEGEPQSIRQALVQLVLSTHFRRATIQ